MKLYEVLNLSRLDPRRNRAKAKKIAGSLKFRSKRNNPCQDEIPTGWRADPHQGSMGASLNWR